jgi:predicted RNase H-like nuclease (RuvC/YqgF family)
MRFPLREQRTNLATKVRKLNDDHPGNQFTPKIAAEFDGLIAEIDALDREINAMERGMDEQAQKMFGAFAKAKDVKWRDAETGARIHVAHATRGSIASQLEGAFKAHNTMRSVDNSGRQRVKQRVDLHRTAA